MHRNYIQILCLDRGEGKTEAMLAEIRSLLNSGTDPRSIVVLMGEGRHSHRHLQRMLLLAPNDGAKGVTFFSDVGQLYQRMVGRQPRHLFVDNVDLTDGGVSSLFPLMPYFDSCLVTSSPDPYLSKVWQAEFGSRYDLVKRTRPRSGGLIFPASTKKTRR